MQGTKTETRKSALQLIEITVYQGQVKQQEQNQMTNFRASDINYSALRTSKQQ